MIGDIILHSGSTQEKCIKCTWLPTDFDILSQINDIYPSLENDLPCILSHVNGMDKGLVEFVVENPTKGLLIHLRCQMHY